MTTRLQQNIRNTVRQATKIRYELWLILIAALIVLTYCILTAPDTGNVRGAEDAPTAEELAASPAKQISADVISKYPNAEERVNKRTAASKTFYIGEDVAGKSKYTLDTSIGPIHYQDAQGGWQEIDTTIESDAGTWDWKMEKAGFQVHGKNDFASSEVVEFKKDNEWVRLTPGTLQYSNDSGGVQPIASPKALEGALKGNKISWTDAYGQGRDFSWEISPSRLAKLLTINNKSDLPPVQKTIADGKNPVLELSLKVGVSKGATIFIDGKEWQGEDKDVQGYVEFRDKEGDTLWHFAPPFSWDSSDPLTSNPENPISNQQLGTFRFKKSGDQLSITHRVPLSFIEKAVFPVMIDANLEVSVAASADDVYRYGASSFATATAQQYTGYNGSTNYYHGAQRYTNITIPQGATINTGTYVRYVAFAAGLGTSFYSRLQAEATNDATQITTYSDFDGRLLTTAKTDWDSSSLWTAGQAYDSPELQSVIQEVISRAGWSSGYDINIFWKDDGSTASYRGLATWDHATYAPPLLHIEYTVAAPATISGNIYTDEGSTAYNCDTGTGGTNLTVNLKVNGAGTDSDVCTTSDGSYSIADVSVGANDIITVYLDGETEKAVTVTKYNTGDLNNLHLYQNHVITRAETGSLTIDNMDNYDKGNDADILFTATNGSPDTLTVDDGQELYVWTGDTFAPGGNLTAIDDIKIVGTYTASGSETITVSGSWANSGTFTSASSTVTFDAGSGTETIDSTGATLDDFYDLVFNDGGTGVYFVLESTLDVNNNLTITSGILDTKTGEDNAIYVGGSWSNSYIFTARSGTVTFDATTTGKTITDGGSDWNNVTFSGSGGGWSFNDSTVIAGDLDATAGTLSGTNDINVNGGGATGNGTITLTGGTFRLDYAGNFGGNTAWTFYNLTFGDGSGTTTSTATGSGGVTVTNTLTITVNQTLDAGSKIWTLSASGTPFIKNGAFTASTSTFNYIGTSATTITGTTYDSLGVGTTADANAVTYTMGGTIAVWETLTVGNAGSSVTDTLEGGVAYYGITFSDSDGCPCTPFNITPRGSFSGGTVTVSYTSTAATNITATTSWRLSLAPSGAGSPTYTLASGTTTANTNLTIGNGTNPVTVSTSNSPNLNVGTTTTSADFYILANATLSGAGTGTIKVYSGGAAGVLGTGTINLTGGTFELHATNGSPWFGIDNGLSWTFNNLKFSNDSTAAIRSISTPSTKTYTISDTLTLGDAADSYATNLAAGSNTWILTKTTGTPFVITSGKGVFSAGTSTFRYNAVDGAGNTAVTATTYYNLQLYGTNNEGYDLGTAAGQTITVDNTFLLNANGAVVIGYGDTYDPNVTTKNLTGSGSHQLYLGQGTTWTITGTGIPVSTNYLDYQTSTFRYTGTGATTIDDNTYYNLEIKPASGSPIHSFAGGTTYVYNNLVVGDGTNAVTLSTANWPFLFVYGNATIASSAIFDHAGGDTGNDITITGDLTINGTLSGSGDGGFQARGNVVGAGTVNLTACFFKHYVAASKNFGANSESYNWTFYNLQFYSTGGTPTVTTSATGTGQIIVSANLYLANGATSLTVDNNTNDRILDVNGTVSIGANTTLQASNSALFTVGGSWSNSGNFTANGGTVTFDDNGRTSTFVGTTSFYNLTSVTTSKNMTFTASTTQTVGGALTFNGGACGTQIMLRSSSSPTQWNLNVTGSSTVDYVNVKDSNASGSTIIANNSTNAGNNTNWTISACGPTNSQLMRHGKWFNSSGVEQPFTF